MNQSAKLAEPEHSRDQKRFFYFPLFILWLAVEASVVLLS
jgi:hypothetical protein